MASVTKLSGDTKIAASAKSITSSIDDVVKTRKQFFEAVHASVELALTAGLHSASSGSFTSSESMTRQI